MQRKSNKHHDYVQTLVQKCGKAWLVEGVGYEEKGTQSSGVGRIRIFLFSLPQSVIF